MKSKQVRTLVIMIGLHLLLLFRLQFTAWPEMFSFPYMINHGFRFYTDFVHPYPPLLTVVLAVLYKIFGYNIVTLKIITYALVVVSDIVIFQIAYRASKKLSVGILALAFYVLSHTFLDGNMLWFDTALVAPLLIALLLYLNKQYTGSVIFLFIAILIKQTSVLYLLAFYISIITHRNFQLSKRITFQIAAIGFVIVLFFYLSGLLNDFVNWTIYYPAKYWSLFPGYVDFRMLSRDVFIVAVISVPPIMCLLRKKYLFSLLYLCAIAAIYPRFSFFHMQAAIAISSICLGYIIQSKKFLWIALVVLPFYCIFLGKFYVHFGGTRFFDSQELILANKISSEIPKQSTVLLINEPSHLYTLTNTLPPKPWLDIYGWYYEIPGIQEHVVASLEVTPPKYVIRQEPLNGNWYDLGTYEPKELVSWLFSNYNRVKAIENNVWLWEIKN